MYPYRTAPDDWGSWPPTQQRINQVVERAARKLAELIVEEEWAQGGTVLIAQPENATALDCSFSGQETEIFVGYVRALTKHKGWIVYWAPATDTGRLARIHTYDRHA
jgi:hypothetical protein